MMTDGTIGIGDGLTIEAETDMMTVTVVTTAMTGTGDQGEVCSSSVADHQERLWVAAPEG
jgi:hypothetical protein